MSAEICTTGLERAKDEARAAGKSRPKADRNVKREVRELAGLYAPEAIKTLVNILRNRRVSHATRIAAASAILDRAVGKPAMPAIEAEGDGSEIPIHQELTPLELARRVAYVLQQGLKAVATRGPATLEATSISHDPDDSEDPSE